MTRKADVGNWLFPMVHRLHTPTAGCTCSKWSVAIIREIFSTHIHTTRLTQTAMSIRRRWSATSARFWHFDSLGNPTDSVVSDANELLETPTVKISYDPDGNPKQSTNSSATYLYEYDALGRLREIKTEEKVIRYAYDPLSRLYSKEVTGSPTTYYLHDQEKEICSNSPLRRLHPEPLTSSIILANSCLLEKAISTASLRSTAWEIPTKTLSISLKRFAIKLLKVLCCSVTTANATIFLQTPYEWWWSF